MLLNQERESIIMTNNITEDEIKRMLTENRLKNSENNLIRYPFSAVDSFRDKIRSGDYHNISFADFDKIRESAGSSASELKLWEYYTVSAICMAAYTAADSGAPRDDVFDLSDTMLQRLERAHTAKEMHEIIVLCATLMAYMVHQQRMHASDYLVERAKTYISRHIFQKISLQDVAAELGVNASYLSRYFSEHEHITMQHYVMREKMQIACNLLRYSDRSIAEISQYLSIPSQSNFTENFRKYIGTTPQRYRNSTPGYSDSSSAPLKH